MIPYRTTTYILDQSDKDLFARLQSDTDSHSSIETNTELPWYDHYFGLSIKRGIDKFWYGSVRTNEKEFAIRRIREWGRFSSVEIKGKEFNDFYEKTLEVKFLLPLDLVAGLAIGIILCGLGYFFLTDLFTQVVWFSIILGLRVLDCIVDMERSTRRFETYVDAIGRSSSSKTKSRSSTALP